MRLNILFIFLIFPVLIFSQSPEKFSYQSVIKNSRGYLLKNQEVGLRISILFNSANGAPVYSEEHTALSNDDGHDDGDDDDDSRIRFRRSNENSRIHGKSCAS